MDTSQLSQQVTTIIGQLHGLFDEIGVPSQERESRETELFAALSETLNNQLQLVSAEKIKLTEQARNIIKTIRQMEASLEDPKPNHAFTPEDAELKVYAPLTRCIKSLKEKHNAIAKLHRERFEQVKKLVVALESYSSHLEPSFVRINLPPTSNGATIAPTFDLSPSYVASLDEEFTRVYEEYTRRIANVKGIAEEIVTAWAELGTPQAQTDSQIIKHYRDSPEQLGLHEQDVARLLAKRDKLIEEKRMRERRLKELRVSVEELWERLGVDEMDRKRFLAGTRGCGLRVINEFEAELDRLNELKRQNLHLFVEDARYRLQELWDQLYFSEEEMLEFTPAFSDVYSDALLSAHEAEIGRLEALKEQRLPILQLIDRHRALVKDREDLAASSQDASRLMLKGAKGERRDPTRLLREEKMRKKVAKELPKIEADLQRTLEAWEDEYGRPFLVHGDRYLDDLAATAAAAAAAAASATVRGHPARSKTPSVPPSTGRSSKASAPASRQGSVARSAPSRNGAKTPVSTIRKNPLASSMSSVASKPSSPSKIPSRMPLSTMKTGSNSPERRPAAAAAATSHGHYDSTTIRKMGPPPLRAPPPKMRDLFVPPSVAQTPLTADSENWKAASVMSTDSGPIRPMSPEDVYDKREHMSYAPPSFNPTAGMGKHSISASSHSSHGSHSSNHGSMHSGASVYKSTAMDPRFACPPPPRPASQYDSRVASQTSASSQGVSGSENWETYDDDASETAGDARERYYASNASMSTSIAASTKRANPDGGYISPGHNKKLRNAYDGLAPAPGRVQTYIEEHGQMVPAGSDAGWTDEDAF